MLAFPPGVLKIYRNNNQDEKSVKPIKVLLVSPVGEVGGAEQVFLALAKRLPEYGVQPVLACLRPGPLVRMAEEQGLRVYAFREHRLREVVNVARGIRWLTKLVIELEADIIHCNHAAHLYGGPGGRLAGTPELWHLHDYPYKPDFIERLLWRVPSRHVLFTTERVKEGYPQLTTRPHTVIAPTCVDSVALQAITEDQGVRQRYGLPEGPLFLTVARLQKHKGHQYLIDAVPAVLRSYPNAIFALIGKANGPEQESYRDSLIMQCEKLGISNQVRLLGFVGDADLFALYRSATTLVHPALSEGFGLTLIEAMAMDLPVIAADADGPKELITHLQNGWLVPTANSESLSVAICTLLQNPIIRQTLSTGGRESAAQMSVDTMTRKTAELYFTMVQRYKPNMMANP